LAIDFSTIFSNQLNKIKNLELKNKSNRKKLFDENELKAFNKYCPNVEIL
jgi:hypothetical protein